MKVETLKILFVIVSFLEAVFMGSIPIISTKFKESPTILGIANAFSGGVFVAIALIHILPEQSESYAEQDKGDFPMPFFLVLCGYTLILIIDKVLFDTHVILGDHDHEHEEDLKGGSVHASQVLRKSIAEIIRKSTTSAQGENVRVSQVHIENALRQSMSKMLRKSEVFAQRVSQAKHTGTASIHGADNVMYHDAAPGQSVNRGSAN